MTIPHSQPRISEVARERRKEIRRVIRDTLPGLLNAEAVRLLAARIDDTLFTDPVIDALVTEGVILRSEVEILADGRSRWPISVLVQPPVPDGPLVPGLYPDDSGGYWEVV